MASKLGKPKKEKKPGRIATWWANRKAKAEQKKKEKAAKKAAKKGTPIGDESAGEGDLAAELEAGAIEGARASAAAVVAAGENGTAEGSAKAVPIAGYLQRRIALADWTRTKVDGMLGSRNFLDKKVRGPLIAGFLEKVEKGPEGKPLTRDEQEFVCDVFAQYLSVVLVTKAVLRGDVKSRVKAWVEDGSAGRESVEIAAPPNGAAAAPKTASAAAPAKNGSAPKPAKTSSAASTPTAPKAAKAPAPAAAPAAASPKPAAKPSAPAEDEEVAIEFELDEDATGDLTDAVAEVKETVGAASGGGDIFTSLIDDELGLKPLDDDKADKKK